MTEWSYDDEGTLLSVKHPDTYDSQGNPLTGRTYTNGYDAMGRLAKLARFLLPLLSLLLAIISSGPAFEGVTLSSEDVQCLVSSRHNSLWIPATDITVPWYVTGDFDGDGVLDVAAIVRLNEDEFIRHLAVDRKWTPPNTVVFKPLGTGMSRDRYGDGTIGPLRLLKAHTNAELVLIMHSVRPQKAVRVDVRDYVAVDLCGPSLTHISVRQAPLHSAAAGDSPMLPAPRRLGDTIQASTKAGTRCALYWDGRGYRWHPVE